MEPVTLNEILRGASPLDGVGMMTACSVSGIGSGGVTEPMVYWNVGDGGLSVSSEKQAVRVKSNVPSSVRKSQVIVVASGFSVLQTC